MSISTIFDLLYEELGLEKKCARWVPKLLSLEQKEERIRVGIFEAKKKLSLLKF